jgi:hypothetical protein
MSLIFTHSISFSFPVSIAPSLTPRSATVAREALYYFRNEHDKLCSFMLTVLEALEKTDFLIP